MFHDLNRRLRRLQTLVVPLAAPLTFGALALAAGSCGSVGTSRETARDQATSGVCSKYEMCQGFGTAAGQAYVSGDSCQVDWRAKWESAWPPASCDGKIDPGQLGTCLSAINGTDCTSIVDIATTLFVKCAKAKVCDAGSTADGGP
jgi:hypothetical protein